MPSDLLIRGATVVLPGRLPGRGRRRRRPRADRGDRARAAGAAEEIDARGLHLLPGVIDAHVHFNEPGRTEWEGWATGSRALAAGGATACIEMPLNAHPPTIDGAAFDAKVEAATASSVVDFALWGGLVPGNLDRLDELAERGVVGFKAFMCDSGIEDFPAVDDEVLEAGMARAAALGLPVARPRRAAVRAARPAGHGLARLRRLAPDRGRARGDRGRDRARRAHRLRPARRARQQRRRASPSWRRATPRARPARTT